MSTLIDELNFSNDQLNQLDKYTCPICNEILREAVQTSCGHWLCQICAEELFSSSSNSNPVCPHNTCGETLTSENGAAFFPDRFVRKEVNKLIVKCPNSNDGCLWIGKYGELGNHQQECSFTKLKCSFCKELVRAEQFNKHTNACPQRLVYCPFSELGCKHDIKMTQPLINAHLADDVAGHLHIVADNLAAINKDKYYTEKDHAIASLVRTADQFLSLQPMAAVPDMVSTPLGKIKLQTRVVPDGQTSEALAPYNSTQEGIESIFHERIARSKSGLELSVGAVNIVRGEAEILQTQLQQKDKEILQLKEKLNKLEMLIQSKKSDGEDCDFRLSLIENSNFDGTMIWKIPQFKQRMEDARSGKYTSIFSLPFYSGRYGYKMCLRLYILGDGIGKNSHMSLFFVVMKGEFDAVLQWPFTHKVAFRLINQRHGRDVVDVFQPDPLSNSFQRPKTDMNVASGCPRFVSLSELQEGGFIVDDTVFIKVKVDTTTMKHP